MGLVKAFRLRMGSNKHSGDWLLHDQTPTIRDGVGEFTNRGLGTT